ncbi:hypothetical protein ABMA32_05855 [Mesorhizobium sp. VNQ89]|uniref:hypothetical protein n=1 Tax=Mesorhizobium quangtriensis TaxID=3157709 RepID=UPI0032B7F822
MPIGAATIKVMIEKGFDIQDLLEVAESMELSAPKERSSGAKRQAAYRSRKKQAAVTHDVTRDVTESVTPRVRVEDNLLDRESKKKVRKKTSREDEADFEDELSELGPELLEEFVKLRRGRRAPLTAYAARLFRKDCDSCGLSITEGAEMCISRGWFTVQPRFLSRQQPRPAAASGDPAPETFASMWKNEAKNEGNENG